MKRLIGLFLSFSLVMLEFPIHVKAITDYTVTITSTKAFSACYGTDADCGTLVSATNPIQSGDPYTIRFSVDPNSANFNTSSFFFGGFTEGESIQEIYIGADTNNQIELITDGNAIGAAQLTFGDVSNLPIQIVIGANPPPPGEPSLNSKLDFIVGGTTLNILDGSGILKAKDEAGSKWSLSEGFMPGMYFLNITDDFAGTIEVTDMFLSISIAKGIIFTGDIIGMDDNSTLGISAQNSSDPTQSLNQINLNFKGNINGFDDVFFSEQLKLQMTGSFSNISNLKFENTTWHKIYSDSDFDNSITLTSAMTNIDKIFFSQSINLVSCTNSSFEGVNNVYVNEAASLSIENACALPNSKLNTTFMKDPDPEKYKIELTPLYTGGGFPEDLYATLNYTDENSSDITNRLSIQSGAEAALIKSLSPRYFALGHNYPSSIDTDEWVMHGSLNYLGLKGYGRKEGKPSFTDYVVQEGSIVTISLVPEYGYQYVPGSLKYNGNTIDIDPQASKATYTFVMPSSAVHVTARFEKTSDTITNDTTVLSDATIDVGANSDTLNGTLSVSMVNQSLSTDQINDVKTKTQDPNILSAMDITLNEVIDQVTTKHGVSSITGEWTEPISQLPEPMTVYFVLDDTYNNYDGLTVSRYHMVDGVETLDVLPTTVTTAADGSNVLSFETNKFSTYVLSYSGYKPIPTPVTTSVVTTVAKPKTVQKTVASYSQNLSSLRTDLLGEKDLTNTQFKTLLSNLVKSGIDFTADLTDEELTLLNKRIGEIYDQQLKTAITGIDPLSVSGLALLADLSELLAGKEVSIGLAVSDQISEGDQSLINDYLAKNKYAEGSTYALTFSLLVQGLGVSDFAHPLTITLPIPEAMKGKTDFTLLHVTSDGVQSIPVILNADGTYTFSTSSFSSFVLLDKSMKIEPVVAAETTTLDSPNASTWIWGIAGIILVILGWVGFKTLGKKS